MAFSKKQNRGHDQVLGSPKGWCCSSHPVAVDGVAGHPTPSVEFGTPGAPPSGVTELGGFRPQPSGLRVLDSPFEGQWVVRSTHTTSVMTMKGNDPGFGT